MTENSISLLLASIIFLLSTGVGGLGYRNFKKEWMGAWGLIISILLLVWSFAQLINFYFNRSEIIYFNITIFVLLAIGNIVNTVKQKSLSGNGLAAASFGLICGEALKFLTLSSVFIWVGHFFQLICLSLCFTFLFFLKSEDKFRKEERRFQEIIGEKREVIKYRKQELEEAKKHEKIMEETLLRQIERSNKFSVFFQISKNIGAGTDREKITQIIPDEIAKTWDIVFCGIYLWDPDRDELILKYSSNFSDELVNKLAFKRGEGLAGWVAVEGKPVNLRNPINDPRFKDKHNLWLKETKIEFSSLLCVPINLGERNLGILELIRDNGVNENISSTAFTEEDENVLFLLANQTALYMENLCQHEEGRDAYLNIIKSLLNAIEARDSYTRGHSEQTTQYALAIAKKMRLNAEMVENIKHAANLHDIGKIGVRENVLNKSKRLTTDEYSHIKNHPFMGAQILKPIKSLQGIIPIIYHHHERYDGKGYMDGLKKDEIPLGARILCVADSFEAMTSDRPYHKGMSTAEGMQQLKKNKGTQFDPQVVDAFLEVLQEDLV